MYECACNVCMSHVSLIRTQPAFFLQNVLPQFSSHFEQVGWIQGNAYVG